MNGELKSVGGTMTLDVGWIGIDISIPYSICQHLYDAKSFYKHVESQIGWVDEVDITYNIHNNDKWIIRRFGGCLSARYSRIAIRFCDGNFAAFSWFDTKLKELKSIYD